MSATRRHWLTARTARAATFAFLAILTFAAQPVHADTQTRVAAYAFATYSASTPSTALVQSETLQPGDPNWSLTTSFTYDANGNRTGTSVVGPYIPTAISTSTTYDPSGRFPKTSTDAVGHTTSFTYDPALGLVTSQTDPNNLTTTWNYDAWGRKTLEVRPDGNRTAYAYKLCTALSTEPACPALAAYIVETTPQSSSAVQNGPLTIVYYDALDRVVRKAWQSESDFNATLLSFQDTTYDNLGRVVSTTQPYYQNATPVLASTQVYDQANRVTTRTYADGSTETNTCGAYRTTATDTLGRTTTTWRDSHHVVSVTDPAGQVMAYAYDAFDNLVAMRDPAGNSTTASFNIRGWRLSLNDPDTGSSAYWYDALGRMVAQTDAKGSTIWWSYDAIGRVVERANNGQTLDYFNYDPAHGLGKLWGAARYSYATGSWQFERWYAYDLLSRLSWTTIQTDAQSNAWGTAYYYDPTGGSARRCGHPASHLYTRQCAQPVDRHSAGRGVLAFPVGRAAIRRRGADHPGVFRQWRGDDHARLRSAARLADQCRHHERRLAADQPVDRPRRERACHRPL